MARDVVERAPQAGELGVDPVRGEDARVDRREDRVAHAIAPREVAQLPGRVPGAPLAPRRARRAQGRLAPETDLDRRRLREHPEAEDVVRALTRSENERRLPSDPERRKDHAERAQATAQTAHGCGRYLQGARSGHRFASPRPGVPRFNWPCARRSSPRCCSWPFVRRGLGHGGQSPSDRRRVRPARRPERRSKPGRLFVAAGRPAQHGPGERGEPRRRCAAAVVRDRRIPRRPRPPRALLPTPRLARRRPRARRRANPPVRRLAHGQRHGHGRLPRPHAGALRRRGSRLRLDRPTLEDVRAGGRPRVHDRRVRARADAPHGPAVRRGRLLRTARRRHRRPGPRGAGVDAHRSRASRASSSITGRGPAAGASTCWSTAPAPAASRPARRSPARGSPGSTSRTRRTRSRSARSAMARCASSG